MDIKKFGQRLKELRGNKSQTDIIEIMTEKTGIATTAQTLGRYERGERKPDLEIIEALATTFEVSADYLLGLTDVKSVNADIVAACKYTGLTEGAMHNLCLQSVLESSHLSVFIENEAFLPLCVGLFTIKQDSEKYVNKFNEIIHNESKEADYKKLRQETNRMETKLNARLYLAEKALRDLVSSFDQRNKYPDNYFSDELLNFFAKESKPKGT